MSSPEGVEWTTMIDFGWQGMDVRRPLVPSWVVRGGAVAPMLTVVPQDPGDPLVSKL